MKAKDLDREALLKENRRLFRVLRQRERRIQKEGIELSSPLYAHSKLQDVRARTPKDLRKLDDKELRNLYRDLTYISELKSSTLAGARKTAEKFEPIREQIQTLSKDTQNKYWDVYKKLYERTALMDKFKYSIINEIFSQATEYGTDPANLEQSIIKLYDEIYEKQQREHLTDNEAMKLFENVIGNEEFAMYSDDFDSEEFEDFIREQLEY